MIDRNDMIRLVAMSLLIAIMLCVFTLLAHAQYPSYAAAQSYGRFRAFSNAPIAPRLPPFGPPTYRSPGPSLAYPGVGWNYGNRAVYPVPLVRPSYLLYPTIPKYVPMPRRDRPVTDDPNTLPDDMRVTRSEVEAAIRRLCDEHADDPICLKLNEMMQRDLGSRR